VHTSSIGEDVLSLERLRTAVSGPVVVPADDGYDAARALFYTGFDRRPAAVVQPMDAAEVARVIELARESGIELGVRSGGHSLAGYAVPDGGLVLDLAGLKEMQIDPDTRTAWAGAGLTAAEFTKAAGAYGLATGFGDAGTVGIGGITLGGGVGFLHRKYGMTIDSLLAAEVVTAGGEILHTDADTHPDLFWAIRGGGGNFGVATRFCFRLHEVDRVTGGMLLLPGTPELLASILAAAEAAPEEMSGMVNVMIAPQFPMFPPKLHGELVVAAMLVYAGPAEEAERAFAPFRSLATPIADMVHPIRYPEVYEEGDVPHPKHMTVRSLFVDEVDVSTAGMIADRLRASTGSMSVAQFRVLGGAVARVPSDATAFAHRGRRVMATVAALFETPDQRPELDAWATDVAARLRQGEPGAYVGFLDATGDARDAYPRPTWDRLRRIKSRYDPTNLFRQNKNIPPG
jgi:FAD/FMN-containing dehydrogenase